MLLACAPAKRHGIEPDVSAPRYGTTFAGQAIEAACRLTSSVVSTPHARFMQLPSSSQNGHSFAKSTCAPTGLNKHSTDARVRVASREGKRHERLRTLWYRKYGCSTR